MNIPTTQEIKALHEKYAPSKEVFDLVWTHCCIVRDIAFQLVDTQSLKLEKELLGVGCLLHDIGVHALFNSDGKLRDGVKYVTHGVEGEDILKNEGYSELISRFAASHTGVGLSKKDIVEQQIPIPVKDYMAETDYELLVMYADKFHSKTTPPYFNSFEWYKKDVSKFGEDKVAKFEDMAKKFGLPDLTSLSKKYGYKIR